MTHTISLPADSAKQALTHVLRGHGNMHTLPALGQVQVQSVEGMAALVTTNLDRQVTALVNGAEYDEDGSIIYVPIPQIKAMLDAKIGSLKGKTLSVTLTDDGITRLTLGRKVIEKKNGLDEMPVWDEEDTFFLSTIEDEAYRKVVSAAASDDTRPVLAGVHVTSKATDAGLILEAADGFRMGVLVTGQASVHTADFIIPATAFSGIPKGKPFSIHCQNSGKDERVWLTYSLNDDVYILYGVRLIEGRFPDLRQIIPHHDKVVSVRADDVLEAATYAERYGTRQGCVEIHESEVIARSSDTGDLILNGRANPQISGESYGFRGDFLKWAVEGDDELEMRVGTPNQAAVVHQGHLTMVIMPMVIGAN